MNEPIGVTVDHWNGDGLDCRKQNLRCATQAEQAHNEGLMRNNTTGYKGIAKRLDGKWLAQINGPGNQRIRSKGFVTQIEAALAYDALARQYFGAFGRYNFPLSGEISAR